MTLTQVSAKIDLRLNKGASADYDNLWPYVKQEAFNKAVNEWVRRQVHGKNQSREGDESTTMRVDDLQVLLAGPISLRVQNKGIFYQTQVLPANYLYYKRLTPIVSNGNCSDVSLKSHLREEANVDDLSSLPSFDFEETFHTIKGNRMNIYHNNKFTISTAQLTYYRSPVFYDFTKLSTIVEFKDDITELIVDNACMIIASDIESLNQKALAQERGETNN